MLLRWGAELLMVADAGWMTFRHLTTRFARLISVFTVYGNRNRGYLLLGEQHIEIILSMSISCRMCGVRILERDKQ